MGATPFFAKKAGPSTYARAMPKEWGYGWLEHTPNLTMGLVARGYSDPEAKKILGKNWIKLFKRV